MFSAAVQKLLADRETLPALASFAMHRQHRPAPFLQFRNSKLAD
jgi:hypothetical protein